jgi:hypothetical protein
MGSPKGITDQKDGRFRVVAAITHRQPQAPAVTVEDDFLNH